MNKYFIVLLWFFSKVGYSQKDTEFWFICPEVSNGGTSNYDRPSVFRFSTYEYPAIVSISQPSNPLFPIQHISLPANSTGNIQFPPFFGDVENTPPNMILNKGFFIESTNPITAYYEVIGTIPQNPEIFSLKGKNALGLKFFVPFQSVANNTNSFNPLPSAAIDIVATENNTEITIIPTKSIIGSLANQPLIISLNRGESFSAQSPSLIAADHPSGTKIIANKPIAVTMKDDGLDGGALFGNFCRDLIGTQLVPVEKIGTKYIVNKGFLNGNEFAFVVATSNNTQVILDGVSQGIINEGHTLTLSITNGSHFIESTSPVYVLQMTGIGCELAAEILPALDCSGSNSVRFVRSTNETFYLFLVTKSGNESSFILNGNPSLISSNDFQFVPGSNGQYVSAVLSFSNNQIPENQSSIIENSIGDFQMGFLNGGVVTGCRFGYFSDFGNQIPISHSLTLCPGQSITINGQSYSQPTTVLDTIPGIQGCDTIITYNIQYAPFDLVFQTDSISCSGGQTDLHFTLCNLGNDTLPSVVSAAFYDADPTTGSAILLGNLTINTPSTGICYSGTYTNAGSVLSLPQGTYNLFSVINFDGTLPTPFTLANLPVTSIEECNYDNNLSSTVVRLPIPPALNLGPDIAACADTTVLLSAGSDFSQYFWQDGSTASSFFATTPGLFWVETTDACGTKRRDSILLTVNTPPSIQIPDYQLCPGESFQQTISGFDTYTWAPTTGINCTSCPDVTFQPVSTTTYTLEAATANGCVRRDTFIVTVLPLNTLAKTIEFCPGESVTINGLPYSQPTTVLDTIAGIQGCDTIITYTLQYLFDANSSITIQCPDNIVITTTSSAGNVPVSYNLPSFSSDCPCPGVALTLTQGLPPGGLFPIGSTPICYQATDSCDNIVQCCFTVTISEEEPCDVKEIGCMKYELLRITQNSKSEKSYTVRVTNKCPNPMTYTAIQLPNGMVARAPKENTIFTASPSNRNYLVRNPNFSPFYSIRFKSITDSISGGQSDVFRYTLPPQAQPAFIHITSRLEPQVFYEAHLNTFYCPIEPEQKPDIVTPKPLESPSAQLLVFPNPTTGNLFADLSPWQGNVVQVYILHGTGQLVQHLTLLADATPQQIHLPENLPAGLYYLEVYPSGGVKLSARFVLQP